MDQNPPGKPPLGPGRLPIALQWVVLLVLSVLFALALDAVHLPAAFLLGPMLAGILIAASEGKVRVPLPVFFLAQGFIGSMIARVIPISIIGEMAQDWPLFLAGVVSVIAAANGLGWLLARLRVLPGTAAIWGAAPGGATPMILMAEAFGADFRLVAFMQYLRVVCVSVAATVVGRLWVGDQAVQATATDWFPDVAWLPLAETCALAASGYLFGRLLRIPAAPLLVPLGLGVVLQDSGAMTITLPPWLLVTSYAMIGWSIGLRFTRPILAHAARALPGVFASILTLIVACAGIAALLVLLAGIDPLTAYLATSPGGVDSVAIIAASSHVDMPFVMAMQTARFLTVLLLGPSLARFLARRMGGPPPAS